jgi:rSAM/selenodomain-associated transferase 1
MTHLLVFLKAPRIGFVKTRLAREVGDERAHAAYVALVERQLGVLPGNVRVEIVFTPADAEGELRDWLGDDFEYFAQIEGDLGERLEAAVGAAFARGAERVICIGGDCPALGMDAIAAADALLLGGTDLVFGPSEDGGYYLIGLERPTPEIFDGIPWSGPDTLSASIKKAASLGRSVGVLETLYDVDEAKELERAIGEGRIQV